LSTDSKEIDMKRDRIESSWKQFKPSSDEQAWDELTTDDQLVNRIRESYGIADDETECQVTDWQARLK
jgi:uncharacterized protein YjbJ (UPF0337 family)